MNINFDVIIRTKLEKKKKITVLILHFMEMYLLPK